MENVSKSLRANQSIPAAINEDLDLHSVVFYILQRSQVSYVFGLSGKGLYDNFLARLRYFGRHALCHQYSRLHNGFEYNEIPS